MFEQTYAIEILVWKTWQNNWNYIDVKVNIAQRPIVKERTPANILFIYIAVVSSIVFVYFKSLKVKGKGVGSSLESSRNLPLDFPIIPSWLLETAPLLQIFSPK